MNYCLPDMNVRAKYKMDVEEVLINDQNIVNLLLPNPNPNIDITEQLLGYMDDGNIWHDGVIFPYLYVPPDATADSVASTYICLESVIRPKTDKIQGMYLYFTLFTHKSLMRYTLDQYYGDRIDILLSLVNNLLVVPNKFGIGSFIPEEPKPYYPAKDYYGLAIRYVVPDFKVKKL